MKVFPQTLIILHANRYGSMHGKDNFDICIKVFRNTDNGTKGYVVSGVPLKNHLEPSYFSSMENAVKQAGLIIAAGLRNGFEFSEVIHPNLPYAYWYKEWESFNAHYLESLKSQASYSASA